MSVCGVVFSHRVLSFTSALLSAETVGQCGCPAWPAYHHEFSISNDINGCDEIMFVCLLAETRRNMNSRNF